MNMIVDRKIKAAEIYEKYFGKMPENTEFKQIDGKKSGGKETGYANDNKN